MEEEYSAGNLMIAVSDNRIFDYIANHYYEMSKEELKEVLLAVLAVGYDLTYNLDESEEEYMTRIHDELESRFFGEE